VSEAGAQGGAWWDASARPRRTPAHAGRCRRADRGQL